MLREAIDQSIGVVEPLIILLVFLRVFLIIA
jgi:hypothetical protein